MPQQRRIIYAGALPRFGRFCAPHRLYWKVQNLTKHQKEDAYAGTNHTECPDPAFAPPPPGVGARSVRHSASAMSILNTRFFISFLLKNSFCFYM